MSLKVYISRSLNLHNGSERLSNLNYYLNNNDFPKVTTIWHNITQEYDRDILPCADIVIILVKSFSDPIGKGVYDEITRAKELDIPVVVAYNRISADPRVFEFYDFNLSKNNSSTSSYRNYGFISYKGNISLKTKLLIKEIVKQKEAPQVRLQDPQRVSLNTISVRDNSLTEVTPYIPTTGSNTGHSAILAGNEFDTKILSTRYGDELLLVRRSRLK